jgi:anaerobic nitric oxide reductase transcription regulator
VISRAVLRASAGTGDHRVPVTVDVKHFDLPSSATADVRNPIPGHVAAISMGPLRAQVEEFERLAIKAAVETNGGNWAAAARSLGMHRSNLHQLTRRLGLIGGQS